MKLIIMELIKISLALFIILIWSKWGNKWFNSFCFMLATGYNPTLYPFKDLITYNAQKEKE